MELFHKNLHPNKDHHTHEHSKKWKEDNLELWTQKHTEFLAKEKASQKKNHETKKGKKNTRPDEKNHNSAHDADADMTKAYHSWIRFSTRIQHDAWHKSRQILKMEDGSSKDDSISEYKSTYAESETLLQFISMSVDTATPVPVESSQFEAMKIKLGELRTSILDKKITDRASRKEVNKQHIRDAMGGQ